VKSLSAITVLCAAAWLSPGAQSAPAWTGLNAIPTEKPVKVVVEGESRIYFRVTPQHPLAVEITGPTRLRIVSRVELASAPKGKTAYGVQVTDGKRLIGSQQTETEPSDDASLPRSDTRLGQSRQLIVNVKSGARALKIAARGERPVLVRLLTSSPDKSGGETVSLTPVAAARSVSLRDAEKLIPYYSVLPGRPVRFRVIGPTTLELLSRLDFDETMRGTQSYRFRVTDGTARPKEYEFKTTKALTATWEGLPDRIPSKFRRLGLPVTQGTHEISVELLKPKGGSLEIHARIPELAVGNTE